MFEFGCDGMPQLTCSSQKHIRLSPLENVWQLIYTELKSVDINSHALVENVSESRCLRYNKACQADCCNVCLFNVKVKLKFVSCLAVSLN